MKLAHKIRLNPTKEQETYFNKAAGIHRLVFNWGLAEWKRQYESGEKPSAYKLKKEFNQIKYSEYPFIAESHRDAASQPFATFLVHLCRKCLVGFLVLKRVVNVDMLKKI